MKTKLLRINIFLFLVVVAILCFSMAFVSGKKASADLESDFYVEHGAYIRTSAPYGMRFVTRISPSKYTEIVENGEIKTGKTLGMIVVPYSFVEDYIAAGASDYYTYFNNVKKKMIHASFSASQIISVDNNKDGNADWYEIRLVVKDIKFNNINRDYIAIGYIKTADADTEYTTVVPADKRSFGTVVKMANENGAGATYGIQDYFDEILYKADYNAAGAVYDKIADKYYISSDPETLYDDLEIMPVATSYNALPISYGGDTIGYFMESSEYITIRNANAAMGDGYYNDGKPVYAITYSNSDGTIPVGIHGITSGYITGNGIKKLTFKIYVTKDFDLSEFVIGYQGGTTEDTLRRIDYGDLCAYGNIRLFDENGSSIGDYPVGNTGWITVEIACSSASDLDTVLYNVYSASNANKNKPLYISEAKLSTNDLTKKGITIEGADGNGRLINSADSTDIRIDKLLLSGEEAYYNGGKDVYRINYINATTNTGNVLAIDGVTKSVLSSESVQKLTFKMYITSDYDMQYFYVYWNSKDAKSLRSGGIKSYRNISLFDENGNSLYDYPLGQEGWITVELVCNSTNGINTKFFSANSANNGKPLYISEIRFSTSAMTHQGFAIEGANGNARFVNYQDAAYVEMTKLYNLTGKEAYYLADKDIYQIKYTKKNSDNNSNNYPMKIDGIDAEGLGDDVRYLRFRMYVTSTFDAEKFYINWNAAGGDDFRRLIYLNSYDNIRLYNSSGTRIYRFAKGNSGWLTLEVAVRKSGDQGLASLFYLVWGDHDDNYNQPLYIADIKFVNTSFDSNG
ncbi:MAG: hypothetical protein VZQ61_02075 [Christensenellaceae bacterium]